MSSNHPTETPTLSGVAVEPLIDDVLWARVEPLLPAIERRHRHPGRRRSVPDRQALAGVVFVLKAGIQWENLPQELGYGSGMTCWRRLRQWNDAGAWDRVQQVLLAELDTAGEIDWSRATVRRSRRRGKQE